MTEPDDETEVEFYAPEPVYLHEDTCWIGDPDALDPDSGAEGVLAIQYRAGCLWYLDGLTRQWYNVEKDGAKRAKGPLRPVN